MDNIGYIPRIALFASDNPLLLLDFITIFTSWCIIGLIMLFAVTVTRKLKPIPGRYQNLAELFITAFDQLTTDTLGPKHARTYFPLVTTLFLFVFLCNTIVILPIPKFVNVHWMNYHWEEIHWNVEPTANINTPLALGTIVFFVVHYSGIKIKGLKNYIWEYFEPAIEIGKFKIPNFLMFPLNLIGEIAKVISLSFRLFGNIMGGGIIFAVASDFIHKYYIYWINDITKTFTESIGNFSMGVLHSTLLTIASTVVPLVMNAFFVFFVGTVQAFVFSMLALTYIAVAITE